MKKIGNHAFINQLLVYTLVMICVSGTVGLSTVWLRHQISVAANSTKQTEMRITQIERRLAETGALIAAEEAPEALELKNATLALGLVRPREEQIVRVSESPEQRLAARRNIEIFADTGATGAAVQFRLTDRGSR